MSGGYIFTSFTGGNIELGDHFTFKKMGGGGIL